MENVVDLDILQPEPKWIKLHGKTFNVAFVPVGITFQIEAIMKEIRTIRKKELEPGDDDTEKAFDLTVRLCSTFTAFFDPEMSEGWIRKECSANQIKLFAQAVSGALIRSYKGVGEYGKN